MPGPVYPPRAGGGGGGGGNFVPELQATIAITEADDTEISVTAGITHRKVTLAAGAGTYTHNLLLMSPGLPSGKLLRLDVTWEASANPTLVIKDQTSDDTLFSYTGVADEVSEGLLEFVFDGSNWVAFGPNLVASATASDEPADPTPAPPATGLILHLSAGDLTGEVADNAAVATWEDRTAEANHHIQPDDDFQPIYKRNQVNGRAVLDFTQFTMQHMYCENGSLFTADGARTVFVVYKPRTEGLPPRGIAGQSNGDLTGTWFVMQARDGVAEGDPYLATFADDIPGPALDLNQWKRGCALYDGTDAKLYKNGTLVDNQAKFLNTVDHPFVVGANGADWEAGEDGEYFEGQIAEVLVYSLALDDTQRGLVEAYLLAKYPAAT